MPTLLLRPIFKGRGQGGREEQGGERKGKLRPPLSQIPGPAPVVVCLLKLAALRSVPNFTSCECEGFVVAWVSECDIVVDFIESRLFRRFISSYPVLVFMVLRLSRTPG